MNCVVSVAALSAVYIVIAALERTPRLRFRTLPSPRPYLSTDAAWYLVAVAATAVSAFVLRPQLVKLAFGPVAGHVRPLPLAAQLLLAVIVFDFVAFALHVGLHRSDTLWNFHKVHHSTLALDGFATTRAHMLENFVRFVPAQAVLFVIGIPVRLVTPTVAIAAIYGISNHSNLGTNPRWIEAVLVTPRLHRRHHIPATTQHNFGAIFTVWDRLFGTLLRQDTARDERFGVPGEIDTYPQQFATALRQPFLQMRQQRTTAKPDPSHTPASRSAETVASPARSRIGVRLLVDGEAEHHSAPVVLGDVAVRHPEAGVRDIEQDLDGLAGADENGVLPDEVGVGVATRRAILARLAEGEATVKGLAEPFEMTLPAISKHIKVLERAGFVVRGQRAQYRRCTLDAARLTAQRNRVLARRHPTQRNRAP